MLFKEKLREILTLVSVIHGNGGHRKEGWREREERSERKDDGGKGGRRRGREGERETGDVNYILPATRNVNWVHMIVKKTRQTSKCETDRYLGRQEGVHRRNHAGRDRITAHSPRRGHGVEYRHKNGRS